MKKMILLLAMLLSVTASPTVTFASPVVNDPIQIGTSLSLLEKELDLTPVQKEQIQLLRQKATVVLKADFQQMRMIRFQTEDLLQAEPFDEAGLSQLLTQQKEIFGDILAHRIQLHRSISGLLTEEQRAKAKMMQTEWKKKQPIAQAQDNHFGW
jgi:Spy/CpxP family protein refolding chaperone